MDDRELRRCFVHDLQLPAGSRFLSEHDSPCNRAVDFQRHAVRTQGADRYDGNRNCPRRNPAGTAGENPAAQLPNNWGDPLLCYGYGMRYNEAADWVYDTLVVPETVQAGETFTAACLLWNKGSDGHTQAQLTVDGAEAGSVFMAVGSGEYRVVEIECTLEAGEHTLTLGDLSAQVIAE